MFESPRGHHCYQLRRSVHLDNPVLFVAQDLRMVAVCGWDHGLQAEIIVAYEYNAGMGFHRLQRSPTHLPAPRWPKTARQRIVRRATVVRSRFPVYSVTWRSVSLHLPLRHQRKGGAVPAAIRISSLHIIHGNLSAVWFHVCSKLHIPLCGIPTP
jgi:hypothetical protein